MPVNPMQFVTQMLSKNPNVVNNPIAQNYLSVLQSGDAKRGEEIANNILRTYGMTKEQALSQVKSYFHFP